MLRLRSFLQNPFSFLFASSATEQHVAEYVIREHHAGRPVAEIVEDHYVVNRLTSRQIARLLAREDVIRAIGRDDSESVGETL
ncbi:MAG TPA: hypothetical protein VHD91_10640 [Gaiellaceae bacterium]|nr:hypothetical protein [Gaiellaceae bacterium]